MYCVVKRVMCSKAGSKSVCDHGRARRAVLVAVQLTGTVCMYIYIYVCVCVCV